MHELVAHAIPHAIGELGGNGVTEENKVRSEILGMPLREAEDHEE
jgi:hypothetical protein